MHDDPPGPRVFISYAHDSEQHKEQVRRFATFLRQDMGVDARLDLWYEERRRDWSKWAIEHLEAAEFIVVIASPAYKERADGRASPDVGRGSQFEGAIIRDNVTRNLDEATRRILPVILPGRSVDEIPRFLCGYSTTHYVVPEFTPAGVDDLLRALTGVPRYPMPPRGQFVRPTPAEERTEHAEAAPRRTPAAGPPARSLADYATEVNRVCEFLPPKFGDAATVIDGLNKWKQSSRRTLQVALEELHQAVTEACTLVNDVDPPTGPADRAKADAWRESYLTLRDTIANTAANLDREVTTRNPLTFAAARVIADASLGRMAGQLESVRRKGQLIGITACVP